MKKTVSLLLAISLLCALTACGTKTQQEQTQQPTITMEDIYNAAKPETMLADHVSANIRYVSQGDTGEDYLCPDFIYQESLGSYALFTKGAFYFVDEYEGETQELAVLLVEPTGLADMEANFNEKLTQTRFGVYETEEIIQSVEEKDGRITVTTTVNPETIPNMEYVPEGTKAIDGQYVLDAESRLLVSGNTVYHLEDGTQELVEAEFLYDVPAPEAAKSLLAYELTDDLRTVTLVSNPGTDKEVTQTVQLPKGLPFFLLTTLLEDTYATYADAACTQAWADVEGYDADTTVYVVWSK